MGVKVNRVAPIEWGKPVAAWTDAQVGDFVVETGAQNYEFTEAANTNVPDGVVVSIKAATPGSAVITDVGILRFKSGDRIIATYTGTPELAHEWACSGAQTLVTGDALHGGSCLGIDAVAGTIEVVYGVEYETA